MAGHWPGRVATAAGVGVVVGLATASPGWANTSIDINPGNVPTLASEAETDCDENFGGGPHPNQDIWVFVLPGNQKTVGDFVSVTAEFGANASLTIPTDGGVIVTDKGASKAWIATPAGWTLTGASAQITGTTDKFNLTHTCPAGGVGESPYPSPSPSALTSPSASPSPDESSSPSPGSGGSGGGEGEGLPVTGAGVAGMVAAGVALVAGGTTLLLLRRRRELTFSAPGGAASDDS
jgi:LPXTG-motif cell wall-anchored protein